MNIIIVVCTPTDKKESICAAPERETEQIEEKEEMVIIRIEDLTMMEEGEEEGEGREGEGEDELGREEEGEEGGEFSEGSDDDGVKEERERITSQNEQGGREKIEIGESKAEGSSSTSDHSGVNSTVLDGTTNVTLNSSSDMMVGSKLRRGKSGSRLRLVLRPLSDEECSDCDLPLLKEDSHPSPSAGATKVQSCSGLDCWKIEQPVCRLPSPFLNYSQYPSGYCAETLEDCAEIEKMGKLGFNYCEVKGQTTKMRFADDKGDSPALSASLNCALVNGQTECLRALQEQLRRVEERRKKQKNDVLMRDKEEKKERSSLKIEIDDSSSNSPDPPSDSRPTVEFVASKDSKYSSAYRVLEFLPYNPLPTEVEHLIFPERSRPLAIYDDPYWPNKANCIKLVESLAGSKSGLSSFTGTYLSPEARGVE